MLAAVVVLSVLLFFTLLALIILGVEDGFTVLEWLCVALFICSFPIWLIGKLCVIIENKLERKRIKKAREKYQKTSNAAERD